MGQGSGRDRWGGAGASVPGLKSSPLQDGGSECGGQVRARGPGLGSCVQTENVLINEM